MLRDISPTHQYEVDNFLRRYAAANGDKIQEFNILESQGDDWDRISATKIIYRPLVAHIFKDIVQLGSENVKAEMKKDYPDAYERAIKMIDAEKTQNTAPPTAPPPALPLPGQKP